MVNGCICYMIQGNVVSLQVFDEVKLANIYIKIMNLLSNKRKTKIQMLIMTLSRDISRIPI